MYEIRRNGNVFEVTFGGRMVMSFDADASYWIWTGRESVRKVKITGCYGGLLDLVTDDQVSEVIYLPPSKVFPTARECIDARVHDLEEQIEDLKSQADELSRELLNVLNIRIDFKKD